MSDRRADLPLPVAALLRRARNAKSPRDRHDTAYFAWEASVRLAVAARPPADALPLVRPSAGHWVGAMQSAGGSMADAAALALFGHLTEAATGGRKSPQRVEPRELLDALVAYRNRVIGHGAPTRPSEFYADGAALLMDGLASLWAAEVFLPRDARLFHVESVEEDEQRRRRARLLELRAEGPEILDPAGTPDVPAAVAKGLVVMRVGADWTSLFPWVLWRADRESTLFYNSSARQPEYLDFASGDVVRGAAVEEIAPGAAAALGERCRARQPAGEKPRVTATVAADAASAAGDADESLIGKVLNGQYRIEKLISDTGFGAVYEGRDVRLDRRVAIKVMHRARAQNEEYVSMFLREARTLAQFAHPNVVTVHNAGFDSDIGLHFLAIEYVEGRTLHELLQERGPLPLDEACGYVMQACRGLQAAHAHRIIHRDVKPGNMLITPQGVLKLTDYMLAMLREHTPETVIGTPYFMPPEQFEGKTGDARTDIYALGVSFYYMLTMRRPHAGDTPAQVRHSVTTNEPVSVCEHRPDLPPAVWPVVRRMIDRDPDRRFATCNDVIAALEPIVRAASDFADGDPRRFGDFELLGKLGEGGMGIVYLARQRSLDRVVALKMLPAGASEDAVARFRREMKALSRCDHPNVVKILASGDERGRLWYAMEFVEGADLAAVAGELSTSTGLDDAVSSASGKLREKRKDAFAQIPQLPRAPAPLSKRRADKIRELAEAMRDAALGLAHLHAAGIVHRDVKPGNLMLTPERRVVVMDLGLAAMDDASRSLTKDKASILGTLRYMPPEQLQRHLVTTDARADVYALGASFYDLIAERPLFEAASDEQLIAKILREDPAPLSTVNPRVPSDLAEIVQRCVEKDPAARYASAAALADDVQAFLDDRPVSARAAGFGYRASRWVRRHKTFVAGLALGGGIVVLAAVALVVLVVTAGSADVAANTALEVGSQVPAFVFVDGTRRGGAPVRLEVAPGHHDVVLEAPGFRKATKSIDLRLGATMRVDFVLVAASAADPQALELIGRNAGVTMTALEPVSSQRAPPGEPVVLLWPRGEVRPADAARWRIDIAPNVAAKGRLVFRRGTKTLHEEPFAPTNLRTERDVPAAVLSALAPGDEISWGLVLDDGPPARATFRITQQDLSGALAKIDAATRGQPAGVAERLRARCWLDSGLALAAYREAAELAQMSPAAVDWILMGRSLERLELVGTGPWNEMTRQLGDDDRK